MRTEGAREDEDNSHPPVQLHSQLGAIALQKAISSRRVKVPIVPIFD